MNFLFLGSLVFFTLGLGCLILAHRRINQWLLLKQTVEQHFAKEQAADEVRLAEMRGTLQRAKEQYEATTDLAKTIIRTTGDQALANAIKPPTLQ